MFWNILFIIGGIVLITLGLMAVEIIEQLTTPDPEDHDDYER